MPWLPWDKGDTQRVGTQPQVGTLTCDPCQGTQLGFFGISPKKAASSCPVGAGGHVGSQVGTGTSSPSCPSTPRCSQDPRNAGGWQQLVNHS